MSAINKLSQFLTLDEQGDSEAAIGDVKQIVAKLSDLVVEDPGVMVTLIQNGLRRKAKGLSTVPKQHIRLKK